MRLQRIRDGKIAEVSIEEAVSWAKEIADGCAHRSDGRSGAIGILADNLEKLTAEFKRLKAGHFTAEEIHEICHNLHGTVDAQAFADGCAAEQRRLYGCAPDRDALEAMRKDGATD